MSKDIETDPQASQKKKRREIEQMTNNLDNKPSRLLTTRYCSTLCAHSITETDPNTPLYTSIEH